jgi:hypothetical protein
MIPISPAGTHGPRSKNLLRREEMKVPMLPIATPIPVMSARSNAFGPGAGGAALV